MEAPERGFYPPEEDNQCFFPKCTEESPDWHCICCGIGICHIHVEHIAVTDICPTCISVLGEEDKCSICDNTLYLTVQDDIEELEENYNIKLSIAQYCDICGKQDKPLCKDHNYCSDWCKSCDDY